MLSLTLASYQHNSTPNFPRGRCGGSFFPSWDTPSMEFIQWGVPLLAVGLFLGKMVPTKEIRDAVQMGFALVATLLVLWGIMTGPTSDLARSDATFFIALTVLFGVWGIATVWVRNTRRDRHGGDHSAEKE